MRKLYSEARKEAKHRANIPEPASAYTPDRDIVEAARLIRKEIKKAIKSGKIPEVMFRVQTMRSTGIIAVESRSPDNTPVSKETREIIDGIVKSFLPVGCMVQKAYSI